MPMDVMPTDVIPTDVREEGKARSQRIKLDYYRHQTWLTRSRGWLAMVALLAASGYCFYVYESGHASQLSTGPLAMVHAAFEHDCQACHLDFPTPISADALRFSSTKALVEIEAACQHCHKAENHFRDSMVEKFAAIDQHCSGCHTDHQGRDNNMLNINGEKCVQCHGDLPATCSSPSSIQVKPAVAEFSLKGHNDFAFRGKDDKGTIKFDHVQHMLPGQVDVGAKGAMMISMLEPDLRESYRKTDKLTGIPQSNDTSVTLTCVDCHQFSGGLNQVGVGDDEVGRHIAPIVFEKHCGACHSMNPDGRGEGILPYPHAAPWQEVKTLIFAKMVGGQQSQAIRSPRDVNRNVPLVGEGNTGPLPLGTTMSGASEEALGGRRAAVNKEIIEDAVSADLAEVKQRCIQCHEPQDITDDGIAALRTGKQPPLIPERWLTRGIYDHAAHREVNCRFCHSAAYPPSASPPQAGPPNDSNVVMIDGLESCVGCHRNSESAIPNELTESTAAQLIGGQTSWASDSCMECHRYHWQRPTSATEVTLSGAGQVAP